MLSLTAGRKQIPRRCASRNDKILEIEIESLEMPIQERFPSNPGYFPEMFLLGAFVVRIFVLHARLSQCFHERSTSAAFGRASAVRLED